MDLKNLQNLIDTATRLLAGSGKGLAEQDIQMQLLEIKSRIISLIRKYPAGSLATAVIIGYLIGKMIKNDD